MVGIGTVLVLYNQPAGKTGNAPCEESEAGVIDEVNAVCDALSTLGIQHRRIGVRTLSELPAVLAGNPATVAFNLVEGFADNPCDYVMVPAVCAAFGIEVTGNSTPCLHIATDKWLTKAALTSVGVRCPRGICVPVGGSIPCEPQELTRCIVKPGMSDGSEGIDSGSVTQWGGAKIAGLVQKIHETFAQPAIIEEMVGSREINAAVLEKDGEVRVLPLAEIDFSTFGARRPRIVGYKAKWIADSFEYNNTPRIIPAHCDDAQAEKVREMALAAWRVVGCRDYTRVDFRIADDGAPVVIEINPNPDITLADGFDAALRVAGIAYSDFVAAVVTNAMKRAAARRAVAVSAVASPPPVAGNGRKIRRAGADDRDAVLKLVDQPKFFRADELEIAREVFDDAVKGGETGCYQSYVIEANGSGVAGWVCFGPTPCTIGTYDIYWIVVGEEWQGRKLGKALMEFAEAQIRRAGGRIAVIETSSRKTYDPTRAFYAKLGYTESARIADFYGPSDDKIIATKSIDHGP